MKLIPTPKRANPDTAINQGMELSLTLLAFFGLGFLLDRWMGTTPILMIVLTVVAAVGVFVKIRYAYDRRMDELDRERSAAPSPDPGPAGAR